ncbi:hypothetical protein B0H63DRAFT_5925 [Podospora didyma]|uniref:Uncharacterized protein n=1 Tax=Podospora didyma TaxID=330526 RepID=A0AAE0P444_9PEZI|nr:hypothetical protein B0H63DRAFT_5925 [Podospora didyma]
MPPTLDLSRTSHSKMIISPPRINLRRAASYNSHDRGPLSSTSSRFNFNHLVFSPPPSPGLPSLSPPPRNPSRGLVGLVRPRRLVRYTVRFIGAALVLYAAASVLGLVLGATQETRGLEILGPEDLPMYPTPILASDKWGRARWTVSIPQSYSFPLTMNLYSELCTKCRDTAARVDALRSRNHALQQAYMGFVSDSADHDFVDVREAEKAGYLPKSASKDRKASKGELAEKPVCEKSLTFVLETTDAGIGNTLLMLWTAYGIAEKEGRAFFIDDSRWAYGKYADIFQPLPSPDCAAAPRHERLPCPPQARHLVVSAATAEVLFGRTTPKSDLSAESLGPSARKAAFALARAGHDTLFRLIKEDADYVDARARELMAKRIVPKTKGKQNGIAIGVHVRRGDRHPLEYQYRDSYIPLNIYTEAAQNIIDDRFNHTGPYGAEDTAAKEHSLVILASDDPMVHESTEFAGASSAQERIRLASKKEIQDTNTDRHIMRKFTDDTFGWEGGFFAPMFWHLGHADPADSAASRSPASRRSAVPSADTMRLRSLVGRAYMMDMAVLADASDAIVCTVSAAGCRMLAVMMGSESAFEKKNWVNIDGGYEWSGVLSR